MSSRNYRYERDMVVQRWYGSNPTARNPRPSRQWSGSWPIEPADGYGIETPPNLPIRLAGHCLAWRYGLNTEGYGVQTIDGKMELVHRAVFRQTRPGGIPEGKNVHHLCNRPYCFQPSHLYAGTQQDNSDDSMLFRSTDFLNAWERANYFPSEKDTSPLAERLRNTERQDGTHPWEPIEHTPQTRMESFVCERHDYSIPVQGGETRICRICDEFENWEDFDFQDASLIADLWPCTQAAPEIVTAIYQSDLMSDELARDRASAYHRCYELGNRHPNIKECDCFPCQQDRKAFRAAISTIPTVMLNTIESAEELRGDIRAAVVAANQWAMQYLGELVEFSPEQIDNLQRHAEICADQEIRETEKSLEAVLGGTLYHLKAMTPEDVLATSIWDNTIFRRVNMMAASPKEKEDYLNVVAENAASLSRKVMTSLEARTDMENAAAEVLGGLLVGLRIDLMEHIRFQVMGVSSARRQYPHPHADCLAQIRETGMWTPMDPSSPFREGEGYSAAADQLRHDQFSGVFSGSTSKE